jgi:hypothetical protein
MASSRANSCCTASIGNLILSGPSGGRVYDSSISVQALVGNVPCTDSGPVFAWCPGTGDRRTGRGSPVVRRWSGGEPAFRRRWCSRRCWRGHRLGARPLTDRGRCADRARHASDSARRHATHCNPATYPRTDSSADAQTAGHGNRCVRDAAAIVNADAGTDRQETA